MNWDGATAVVTGASRGIGRAVAKQAAAKGARVGLVARSKDDLDIVLADIGGRGVVAPADIAVRQQVTDAIKAIEAELGPVDVLVANAGIGAYGPVVDMSYEEIERVVGVNVLGTMYAIRAVLPGMVGRRRGHIVTIGSIAGRIGSPFEAVYSATKFGLRAFTFALAEELEGSGITLSAVSPGPVDTGFIMEDLDEVPDLVFSQPMSSAEDIARGILDCAADGVLERTIPQLTGYLATAGYMLPALRKLIFPIMERRGKEAKEAYRKRRAAVA